MQTHAPMEAASRSTDHWGLKANTVGAFLPSCAPNNEESHEMKAIDAKQKALTNAENDVYKTKVFLHTLFLTRSTTFCEKQPKCFRETTGFKGDGIVPMKKPMDGMDNWCNHNDRSGRWNHWHLAFPKESHDSHTTQKLRSCISRLETERTRIRRAVADKDRIWNKSTVMMQGVLHPPVNATWMISISYRWIRALDNSKVSYVVLRWWAFEMMNGFPWCKYSDRILLGGRHVVNHEKSSIQWNFF